MTGFWELLKQSVIFQGLLVLGILGLVAYMYVTTGSCPTELMEVMMVIVGFFFGSKSAQLLSQSGDKTSRKA